LPHKIHGDLSGLAAVEKSGLERLYHHATEPGRLASDALVQRMTGLASLLRRQIGVLIDRNGHVTHVICGDHHELQIPDLGRIGADESRLRGLHLVHVHLKSEPLSEDDLNDLVRLGLDLVAAIGLDGEGPGRVYIATLAADAHGAAHRAQQPYTLLDPQPWHSLDLDVGTLIAELESQLARLRPAARIVNARERAILIHVGPETLAHAEDSLDELDELARTARVEVVARVVQRRREVDPRTLIGTGKLSEIALKAMQSDATLLVFDRELTPSQSKSISRLVDMKVVDRTQLILDIFAGRAKSQDGKLQVELAQLRYSLPRLGDRDNSLSRLTGGIGGVGPGETKLELDRRRCRDRIHRIEENLERLARGRAQRRLGRIESDVGLVALVGYTNVGKSSLLNAMAKSDAYTENLLFATLDPTSRRVRTPEGLTVVFTDTVGFIRDLPKELLGAFEATLEEARAADVLLLVLDASHPQVEQQLRSVERILAEHDLGEKARVVVLNKCDAIRDPATIRELEAEQRALRTSTLTREGVPDLLGIVEAAVITAQVAEARLARTAVAELSWQP
jgi:GTP-binding protein HflX